jgi:uncharacterized protein (DUF2126 family)
MTLSSYENDEFYDDMFDADSRPRSGVAALIQRMAALEEGELLAWQPPSCLHPTLSMHTPLIFAIVDTWNDRASGGCSYHVTHPGGRHDETFSVHANEAESRRVSRFLTFGHTPGAVSIAPEDANPQFPYTLDLRR